MAKISVIVLAYKAEQYIHRCVDSILAQSFADFELILVDDGSPDNCGLICDEYARQDNRIHVIHQENGGMSVARNAGIDWIFSNSDSQWLTFVDSDDWIHRDYLQFLYNAALENNCLLAACAFFMTTGEDFPQLPTFEPRALSADDYYCTEEEGFHPAPVCGKLYHKSLFATLRYPVGKYHEDEFTTYLTVYAAGTVAQLSAKLYAYYHNEGSITRAKWSPKRLDVLDAFNAQMAFARERGNDRLLNRVTDSYVWATALQASQLTREGNLGEQERKCHKMLRRKLREILKQGMNGRRYALSRENLLLYEEAYPATFLWKALHGTYGVIKKLRSKE